MPGKATLNFWDTANIIVWWRDKDVDVLCFDHDNSKDMDALMATPLWQAMPFVRADAFSAYPQSGFMGAMLGNALCARSG